MKTLRVHLEDYLRLRRQLGFKMEEAGFLLRNFVRFAEREGADFVSTKLAVQWAAQPHVKPTQAGFRLGMLRRFAAYVSAHDERTVVPPQKLLPYHLRRREPYHYTEQDVRRLIEAAHRISPADRIKGPTLGTLFGLLAVTGMRVGEALALDRGDLDANQALLSIRQAKGNKPRRIPLHSSTVAALHEYASIRDRVYPQPTNPSFFVWRAVGAWSMTLSTGGSCSWPRNWDCAVRVTATARAFMISGTTSPLAR